MKQVIGAAVLVGTLYLVMMGLLSFQQEKLIFFPEKLPVDYTFRFDQEAEEIRIPAPDGVLLHGLHFKSEESKGLVFYLHGNAGSVASWGWAHEAYTALGYDMFVLDYRGYGKSQGEISSEKQFYADAEAAFLEMAGRYSGKHVLVVGYSIGTAAAARLAALHSPTLLLLQAPYYSLSDLMQSLYPMVPGFLLRYKFETYTFVAQTKSPIAIFHGAQDEIIYPGSSEKLKAYLKPTDRVILLEGQGHNGMNENPAFRRELANVLHNLPPAKP
ncbi:alpha/beta fold hydrolase [Pontibacter sp. BT731]|uniref:alpha/beta hydrolase n=1 Tax=Pontibacter coccineus TaxID=3063328 RepID=UPI0026E43385|nr:alpha/beta fold hydrolase [Pontibacter sp. BT731]MDO6388740.1 alpha/beta fold hydrolase [Pontibacter sp. BT731]